MGIKIVYTRDLIVCSEDSDHVYWELDRLSRETLNGS